MDDDHFEFKSRRGRDELPPTYNPPERFEDHWTEDHWTEESKYKPRGAIIVWCIIVGLIFWMCVLSWALVKYL